jgi:formate-dependent nitrite reductase membrane component NrfD
MTSLPLKPDGRNIDSARGTLSGEGAQQIARNDLAAWDNDKRVVFKTEPAAQSSAFPTYYNRPVLKSGVWTWMIPAYYYVGGLSGGSAVLGAAATLLQREQLEVLVLRTRWVATGGALVSSVLLVLDLGRPSRFLNMLRVFRPSSPMSMGSWILVSFSSFAGLSAVSQLAPPWARRIGDVSAIASGVLGLGLAGYTGVLVGNTVVPVWQRAHRLLPVLFLSSATASTASFFDILGSDGPEHRAIQRFAIAGKIAELAAANAIEKQVATVASAVKPLRSGFSGFLWQTGKVLSAASLVLSLVPSKDRRLLRATGVLGTAGAICLRFGIHYAGTRSARDPHATFDQQRAGQGAYEVTGMAAVTGPGDSRAFEPDNPG